MSQVSPFPSIFIIGAQRCATSSLYGHLANHPEIYMSEIKEPRYFSHINRPPNFKGPGDADRVNKATIGDEKRYLELFTAAKPKQLCGEATTTYFGDSHALTLISEWVEHPKIIIMLRNPLERALSCYHYKRNQGLEPADSFEEALNDEKRRIKENWAPIWHYATRSKYFTPTQEAFSIFGISDVMVIRYESFVSDPAKELNRLVDFLALKQPFSMSRFIHYNDSGSLAPKSRLNKVFKRTKSAVFNLLNVSSNFPTKRTCSTKDITQNTAIKLQSEFRDDVLKLEKLLHWDLSDWMAH